jgi:rhodanese-related sulfurtransferase
MTIPQISPEDAKDRLDRGLAILVDIREADEHAREHIRGTRHVPLSRFESHNFESDRKVPAVVFFCQSGNRTRTHCLRLCATGFGESYMLTGGLAAWKSAGLPTNVDMSRPIEIQRQVMIAAGSLSLIGLLLAAFVWPWFIALTAFIGCGLIFSGISGWCGMAILLRAMPWNARSP